MKRNSTPLSGRRSGRAAVLLALAATACTSWRADTRPVPVPLRGRTLSEARLLLKTAQRVHLYEVRLEGDSVIGLTRPPGRGNAARMAYATADVAQVSFKYLDGWKTLATSAAILAGTMLAASLVLTATCGTA